MHAPCTPTPYPSHRPAPRPPHSLPGWVVQHDGRNNLQLVPQQQLQPGERRDLHVQRRLRRLWNRELAELHQ